MDNQSAEILISSGEIVAVFGDGPVSDAEISLAQSWSTRFVAADGGANRLLAADIIPDLVIGDLDSVTEEAKQQLATRCWEVRDQNRTDFEKTLMRIEAPLVLGFGLLGGRLDHQMAVFSTLARFHRPPVILVGGSDVVALAPRKGALDIPIGARFGILPLEKIQVWCSGLAWPLSSETLSPTGLVSSSNTVVGPVSLKTTGCALIVSDLVALPALLSFFNVKS